MLRKCSGDDEVNEKQQKITEIYNNIYHNAMQCSPNEALENYEDLKLIEKNMVLDAKKAKMVYKNRETYEKRERGRTAKKDDINKCEKGSFDRFGIIRERCGIDLYLVCYEDTGKICNGRGHVCSLLTEEQS